MKLFKQFLNAFGLGRDETSNDNKPPRFEPLKNPNPPQERREEPRPSPRSRGNVKSSTRASDDYSAASNPALWIDITPAKTDTHHHWSGPTFDFGGGDSGGSCDSGGGGDGGGGGGE